MAWKADLTIDGLLRERRRQEQQPNSHNVGMTLLLAAAVLVLAFARRGPAMASLPASLDFASQAVQSQDSEQLLLVRSEGKVPLLFQRILIADGRVGDFRITSSNCNNSSIAPHGSCYIGIAFSPLEAGERSAVLILENNAVDSPQKVMLTGTGIARADLTVAPNPGDFGTQNMGAFGEQEFALTNIGSASLTIEEISVSGDDGFVVEQNDCVKLDLAGGQSCVFKVKFTPQATGDQAARLVVRDSAKDAPHDVPLTGSGTVSSIPRVQVQPPSLDFGRQQLESSTLREVVITSAGSAALTTNGTSIEGEGVTEFISDRGCDHATLAPGQSCKLQVRFSPRAEGAHTAQLLIADNAPDSPQHMIRIPLGGSGYVAEQVKPAPTTIPGPLAPPIRPVARVVVHPENLNFGNQAVTTSSAPLQITVTSMGNTAAQIQGTSLQGKTIKDFGIQDSCKDRSLAPTESCLITVTFKPEIKWFGKYPSQRSAELVISVGAVSPQKVNLAGTALPHEVPPSSSFQLRPTELDFGELSVDAVGKPQTVTLINSSSNPIQLSGWPISDNPFVGIFKGRNSGHFRVDEINCPQNTIPAQGQCSITVVFTPQSAGDLHGYLTLYSSSPLQIQSVNLRGVGKKDQIQ